MSHVSCIGDLVTEAKYLWVAESKDGQPHNTDKLSACWGCVALIAHPKFKAGPDLETIHPFLDGWEKHILKEPHYSDLAACKAIDGSAVDEKGCLQIDWPELANGGGPVPMDLLIATATKPRLKNKNYPSEACVAEAWKRDQAGHVNYFCSNIKNGIHTFQDGEIFACLRS